MPRTVIVGGGSGGTILANTLARRHHDVTMVTASLDHLFQPALLYVAFTGAPSAITTVQPTVVRDERRLLSSRVQLVHDRAEHIDLESRVVATGDGSRIDYDNLVVATGMQTDPAQIPGLTAVNDYYGDYHSTVPQALKLRSHLESFDGGTIVLGQSTPICKCPPSPIEGILLIEQFLVKRGLRDRTRLLFLTPFPRPYPSEGINDIVEPILKDRGIEVMTFFDVDRIDPDAHTIRSIEGDEVAYDLPVVIPPFVGANIAYSPAGVIDQGRFLRTDRLDLRVEGFDNVFAIGDATNIPTSKSGVTAHLEAKTVAKILSGQSASFNGRTHCPMDLAYGKGTFVIGSYAAPVRRYRPSALKHSMKTAFGRLYFRSLSGVLDPVIDLYFALTSPDRSANSEAGAGQEGRR